MLPTAAFDLFAADTESAGALAAAGDPEAGLRVLAEGTTVVEETITHRTALSEPNGPIR